MSVPLVRAEGVEKVYRLGHAEIQVLRGVDISLAEGEIVILRGKSGAGKSTLLHILGLLDRPWPAGRVMFEGADVSALSERERAAFRNRAIGFIFQFYHLLPEFSARENIMIPALISGTLARRDATARADELLEAVELSDRARHRPSELSGGERQRVAIARALMMKPRLLLADEPTGNLDTKTGEAIRDLLWDLNKKEGSTLLVATHEERLQASADRVLRIADGKIVNGA